MHFIFYIMFQNVSQSMPITVKWAVKKNHLLLKVYSKEVSFDMRLGKGMWLVKLAEGLD